MRKSVLEKFSIMAGVLAFMIAMFLFRMDFPALPPIQKAVLAAHMVAGMACGLVGGRRPLLGLVVLPLVVLALTSLTCWWIVSRT